jgi:hypothetical protein
VALLRILFLFMRSTKLRGAGDRDPQLAEPNEVRFEALDSMLTGY